MAIEFINDLLDKQGGSINKTASAMAELRKKSGALESLLNSTDQTLANMDTALPLDLPTLQDFDAKLADIDAEVRAASADVADISGIAGSCLSGALGSLNSIKKDGYSIVRDGMNSLEDLAGIPNDMLDLTSVFDKVKDNINSLGISDLIDGINTSLGCLESSSLISDVQNELNGIQDTLGLDASGAQDPSAYKQMMSGKLSTVPGLDPSYQTWLEGSMSRTAEQASDLGNSVKQDMLDSVADVKNSVPKLPTPPKFF